MTSPSPSPRDDKLELVTVEEQEEFLEVLKQLNLATSQQQQQQLQARQAASDRNALAASGEIGSLLITGNGNAVDAASLGSVTVAGDGNTYPGS